MHSLTHHTQYFGCVKRRVAQNASLTVHDRQQMAPELSESPINSGEVRRLRKSLKWTQTDLARHAQLSLPTIQRVERGDETVTRTTMQSIAAALGVELADIYPFDAHAPSGAPAWFTQFAEQHANAMRDINEKLDALLRAQD